MELKYDRWGEEEGVREFLDAGFGSRDERRGGFQSFPRRDHAMTSRDQPHRSSLDHRRGEDKERIRGESGEKVFVADQIEFFSLPSFFSLSRQILRFLSIFNVWSLRMCYLLF